MDDLDPRQKIAVLITLLVFILLIVLIIGTFATNQSGKPDACGAGTALVQTNQGAGSPMSYEDELVCVPLEAK